MFIWIFALQNAVLFIPYLGMHQSSRNWNGLLTTRNSFRPGFQSHTIETFISSLRGKYHLWVEIPCKWSYWALDILTMTALTWQIQRKMCRGGLKKEWDFEWRGHLNCQCMRVSWAAGLERRVQGEEWSRSVRKKKFNIYSVHIIIG